MFKLHSFNRSAPFSLLPKLGSTLARPALALLLLITASSGCQRESAGPVLATQKPVERPPFDARLSLVNNSGRIDFNGVVDNAATQTSIQNALRNAYGTERISGAISLDNVARQAKWSAGLPAVLKAFEPAAGAALRFEGDRIVLSGLADATTRAQLRDAAKLAYPDAKLEGLFAAVSDDASPAAITTGKTMAPAKIAKTLNQMPVKFEDGSGNVSADSLTLITRAADAIRAAPTGTRLLIVGPVVASKDAGNDVFLSKQRAEALKVQLILNGVNPGVIETRGWGQNADGTTITDAAPPPEGASMRFELTK